MTVEVSVLLVEDTPAQARLFIRNIRQKFEADPSTNVRVEWYESIDQALQFLQRSGGVDQIFCDRGLPGLESNAAFEAAFDKLKPFALTGESRILTQSADPELYERAERQHVEVIQKGDTAALLVPELIRLAFAKRSNSTLSLANVEMQRELAKVQMRLEQLQERQQDIKATVEQYATLRFEVESIKRSLNEILEEMKAVKATKAANANANATARFSLVAAVSVALVGGIFGFLNVVAPLAIPKLIDQFTPKAPSLSPPAKK